MLITSIHFTVFVFVVLIIYYCLPQKQQNLALLVASGLFLLSWSIESLVILALLTIVNYWLARKIGAVENGKQWLLWIGIAFNLLALVYLKYNDFLVPYMVYYLKRIGLAVNSDVFKILLPVGLSYYVLQAISYLVDVKKSVLKPIDNFVTWAIYMLYFPRVLSGPVEKVTVFIPQLERKRVLDKETITEGGVIFVTGLVRKIVLADMLFLFIPEDVFINPGNFQAPLLAFWLLAYAFAIYNDFAGYTDIVRGISRLLGIRLTRNFIIPYLSASFSQFWQRWHASLSIWLRNYIFMPLTRKLMHWRYDWKHIPSAIIPVFVTMLVTALWHYVSWNMLLWGAVHALYQVIARLGEMFLPRKFFNDKWKGFSVFSTGFVFLMVVLAWIPFRMELPVALSYWNGLIKISEWGSFAFQTWLLPLYLLPMAVVLVSTLIDFLQHYQGELAFTKISAFKQALLINFALVALIVALFAQAEAPPPFIYQDF